MEYFMFLIVASYICTGVVNEGSSSKFPYSKCQQTATDVICEPLNIHKGDVVNTNKTKNESETQTFVKIDSGYKDLTMLRFPNYGSHKEKLLRNYYFDMIRSVTVSKIEMKFKGEIPDGDLLRDCRYSDFDYFITERCDKEENRFTPYVVNIYFRNVRGRYIYLELSRKPLILEYLTVVILDPETCLEANKHWISGNPDAQWKINSGGNGTQVKIVGGRCYEDLGMADGSIQDFQISASSWNPIYRPSDARLSKRGWSPNESDENPWFMVDLIIETTVESMTIYSNTYAIANVNVYAGTEKDNLRFVLQANFSENTCGDLFNPVQARYIKSEILQLPLGATLRFELKGCKLSGVPALKCYNAFEMFEIGSEMSAEQETVLRDIYSEDFCNSFCLQNDNCSAVSYSDTGDCVHYMPRYLDKWQKGKKTNGNWSGKLCTEELFPTLHGESGIIISNIAYIETTALITSIGYPFAYGSGQEYRWIVKFVETKYINIIFTNVSFDTQVYGAVAPCNLLMLSKYIDITSEGKAIDHNFNDRVFVVETGESLLVLTFTSCPTLKVITSRGFRAFVSEKDIPACLSIDSDLPWNDGRHESCRKPEMVLTSMSILNFPFHHEERWDIYAGNHHIVQIKVLNFYVVCAAGKSHSIFKVVDIPDTYIICNNNRLPANFTSKNSEVSIIFRKNYYSAVVKTRKEGFRIRYKIISFSLEKFVDVNESTSKVCSKVFGKCYSVSSSVASWIEAEAVCWRHNQRLVTVQSKSELHFLHYLLRKTRYHDERIYGKQMSPKRAHIGLRRRRDQNRNNVYVWQNNSPITFLAWSPGNPTNADCTRTVFEHINEDNTLESEHCTEELAHYFVCETEMEERAAEDRKSRKEDVCGLNSINVNVTYSGKTCQSWDALTTNATKDFIARFGINRLPSKAFNYCKDLTLDGILWCYITDRHKLEEPCFLKQSIKHEDNESSQNISMQQYQCDDGETVIPQINRCDGIFDCSDYSDEMYCRDVIGDHLLIDIGKGKRSQHLHKRLEKGSYYQCSSKEWISIIARCDGFIDCLDASDELDCNRTECSGNEFACADSSCVHLSQVCDFIPDCPNAEDEFCEIKACTKEEFMCDNKQCIPKSKRCDAVPDCIDKSDERACELCKDSFHCDTNKCIPQRLRCDRFPDCKDLSDEMSCLPSMASACDKWWELGYRKSGQYIIDDIAVDCDFSSLYTDRTITMSIRITDVPFEHIGALFTRYPKIVMTKEETDMVNKFRDIILRDNYRCVLQVKQNCHFPESEVASLADPHKRRINADCQCVIDTLTPVTVWRNVSEINFKRVDLTRCDGTKISQERDFPALYYTFTERFHVDRRILQKMIPVEIAAGPIKCSFEYTAFKPDEEFHCKGDDRKIPKSMICLYDTDAAGFTIGCRSGNHLENCGSFNCPTNTVKCPNSYCIPQRFVCDGNIQCPEGEDEKGCTCRDFGREILILKEEPVRGFLSDSNTAAVALARQLYTRGSIIRLLNYKATTKSERFSVDMTLLEIQEEHIYPFEAVEIKRECQYKSIARNVLQSLQFSVRKTKGLVFIEDSEMSSTIAEKMFSNISKPAFTIYRVFKKLNPLYRSLDRYTCVNDIPVNKWKSLFSLGYKMFPEVCNAALQVPCAGSYRCSSSKQCLPLEQLCDGIVQCVNGDDERLCDFKCPGKCKCEGQEVKCRSAGLTEFDIRNMSNATQGGDFSFNPGIRNALHENILCFPIMLRLNVSSCKIESISTDTFLHLYNLRSLDIGYNTFIELPDKVFSQLHHLTELNLDGNRELTVISSSAFHGLKSIRNLRISGTKLKRIAAHTFSTMKLHSIVISYNEIEEIEDYAFNNISVQYINFIGNSILNFNKNIFKDVTSLRELRTPAYKFCCIRPCYMKEDNCYPAKNEFSSCGDLMRHPILQAILWIVGIAALLGNFESIFYRLFYDRERLKIGYGIFVTNLAAADFLMGVYLIIIATVDSLYRKRYIYMDDQWRNSTLCVTAGILSMVSSEASVLFLCLITLDRLLVIKFPFGNIKFLPRHAHVCCCLSWIFALVLAVIPVFYTGHFENKFYSRSGVCVALPLTRDKPPGWIYSVAIFVGLNFFTFLLVALGQLFIFLELRKTTRSVKKTQKSRKRDLQVARNLILVATTDFLCWFPIGLMGIMALSGHTISGDVYAWTAVFVLPLNSALNPVLYTLTAIIGKRSFNPSTEEQSRVDIQTEFGIRLIKSLKISRSVRMIPVAEMAARMRSVQDILKGDENISVVTVAAFSRQLARLLRLLNESCVGLEQLDETNTYISIDKSKTQKMIVSVDSKATISKDKKLIEDNMHKFGVLLRKLILKCNRLN